MMRFFWVFLGVIAVVVIISVVLNAIFFRMYYPAGTNATYPYNMMYWGYGGFWGLGAMMMIVPFILLILFILWIVSVAGRHGRFEHNGWHSKDAMDILNERYASGSITQEEYNRIKEEITKK